MIGTSLPAQGESVSPRERRSGSVGSRRNDGMRRFRAHAITGIPPRATGGTVVRIWRLPPVSGLDDSQDRLADRWWQRWPDLDHPITGVTQRARGGGVVRIWRLPPVS